MAEPWDDDRLTAFGMLVEASKALVGELGAAVEAGAGIPVVWFEVLLRLARSPGRELRMAELARQVRLSTSGTTRLVDRLEEAGLVRRAACPSDRRGQLAVLTAKGEKLLRKALPAHLDAIQHRMVEPMGRDLATLESLLRRLRDQ